jgi:hypothetical protein
MDDKEMDRVVKELRLPAETAKHRAAISRIAAKRRELPEASVRRSGQPKQGRTLG